jgi:hypothetical protein
MCMEMRGDAVVVFEGSRRLQWERAGAAWRLAGLWPTEPERELLNHHLEAGRPLLVVLDREPPVVSALAEEVPRIPDGLLIRGYEAEVLDLEVPALDWLPEPMRSRGTTFAVQAAADERAMPLHTLPPLLVDPAPPGTAVRFGMRTATCRALSDRLLDSTLRDLFAAEATDVSGRMTAPFGHQGPPSPRSGRDAARGAASSASTVPARVATLAT